MHRGGPPVSHWGTNMAEPTRNATLTLDGNTYDLPVMSPTAGPDVLDIRKLYGEADVFTFDPGFTSTASCESAITFIGGDVGELLHRGYPIEQLAEKSSYLEVCYLLLYGELPTAAQLAETLRLHFAGQGDVVVFSVRSYDLGMALRWEPSRGGQLFPHLYGELHVGAVGRHATVSVAADGSVALPEWVE